MPDPQIARRALEDALEEWRTSPETDSTAATGRSMIFVDQQRRPGQKLREFAVLGATVVDNCRRFVVRLSLAEPEESMLAAYYVFDKSPIWVYRVEDFDMMMHMDSMPDDVPLDVAPGTQNASKAQAGPHGGEPPSADPAKKTG